MWRRCKYLIARSAVKKPSDEIFSSDNGLNMKSDDSTRLSVMRRILHLSGWAMVATIGILSLVPAALRPHTGLSNQLEHFAAYFVTASTLVLPSSKSFAALRVVLALGVFAGLLEIAQLWVPGRGSRLTDFAAGFLGTCVGCILTVLIRHFHDGAQRN